MQSLLNSIKALGFIFNLACEKALWVANCSDISLWLYDLKNLSSSLWIELWMVEIINNEMDLNVKLLFRVKSLGLLLCLDIKLGFINLFPSKSMSLA